MLPFICLKFIWAEFTFCIILYLYILAYFIACLIFVFTYLGSACSFLIEIIVTFSIGASGRGHWLCPIVFLKDLGFQVGNATTLELCVVTPLAVAAEAAQNASFEQNLGSASPYSWVNNSVCPHTWLFWGGKLNHIFLIQDVLQGDCVSNHYTCNYEVLALLPVYCNKPLSLC